MKEKELIKKIESLNADKIQFAVTDIDGILRGKIISKNKFLKGLKEGLGFCNVIFGWDCNDVVYDNTILSGWHTGYPDAKATIDTDTFRTIPWNNNLPFFIADFSEANEISNACPRTLLKRIRQQSIELGFTPNFAKEYEWFNFIETSTSLQEKNFDTLTPLTSGMFGYSLLRPTEHQSFFNSIFDLLSTFGIPLEGLHTETGPGVYEAAIDYTDVLEAADRAVLFKTSVKQVAYKQQVIACFMAKWNKDLPGCSGHIHQSLWDDKGSTNLFFNKKDPLKMSDLMRHYIAGQLYCLPHILPMYAPTTNSYKRYVEGAWAATSVSWGIENRTTALRVINHSEEGMRLETRVPGADANPYLSLAASLASGLYGIKHKLALNTAATAGSEYANSANIKLPKTLHEATEAMKSSGIAKELFGEGFSDHFIRTREWEWRQYSETVPKWELKRYFEII